MNIEQDVNQNRAASQEMVKIPMELAVEISALLNLSTGLALPLSKKLCREFRRANTKLVECAK